MTSAAEQIAAKIAAMKTKRQAPADVFQNPDGSWSHALDHSGRFSDEVGARTDLRFCKEWGK